MKNNTIDKYKIREIICYLMIGLVVLLSIYLITKLTISYIQLKDSIESELNLFSSILIISADTMTKLTLNFIKSLFFIISVSTFIITIIMLIIRNTSDLKNLELKLDQCKNNNVDNSL